MSAQPQYIFLDKINQLADYFLLADQSIAAF